MIMRKWKVILVAVSIFAAGAVTGSVLTVRVIQKVTQQQINPERWPTSLLNTYQKRLKLTPEQMAQMKPALESAHEEWRRSLGSTVMNYGRIVRQLDEQLAPLLTPEQKQAHEELRQEMRHRLRQRLNIKLPNDS
jgi:Spy/CpxP family protein refolding chaperone